MLEVYILYNVYVMYDVQLLSKREEKCTEFFRQQKAGASSIRSSITARKNVATVHILIVRQISKVGH